VSIANENAKEFELSKVSAHQAAKAAKCWLVVERKRERERRRSASFEMKIINRLPKLEMVERSSKRQSQISIPVLSSSILLGFSILTNSIFPKT